jgi:protoheme IX farnesyltransferase
MFLLKLKDDPRLLKATTAFLLISVLISWAVVSSNLSWSHNVTSATSLFFSLSLLGILTALLTVVYYWKTIERVNLRISYHSQFGHLSFVNLILLFALLLSGMLVTNNQAGLSCASWPLCSGGIVPTDPAGWLNFVHRGIVLLSGIMMVILLLRAWRTQRSQTAILVATTVGVILFFAQALMGIKLVDGFPHYMVMLHKMTAAAVWIAFVVQIIAVGLAARSTQAEKHEAAQIQDRKSLWKDLLMLTKPIVVVLLLVTTFAGMVIGARAWPRLDIFLWTILGGFMAAGGSGAINQYIDRDDDRKMQRTQKRPIPAGRLTPAEGLSFGAAMTIASFFLVAVFVNMLSALLVLAGIIYYVVIYSMMLKKSTVQNIVIGGGAGAIPPLVGWAAATGNLDIAALLLFAVVFIWTPPHFWALALVRRKDYARAGVPMLPVVRGEAETRKQIFFYTALLVGLTLVLPLFGLGGMIYLLGAVLLGLWLLAGAMKVWRLGGNKLAWKMYRYSSMYLAFLFLLLMIDRLVS